MMCGLLAGMSRGVAPMVLGPWDWIEPVVVCSMVTDISPQSRHLASGWIQTAWRRQYDMTFRIQLRMRASTSRWAMPWLRFPSGSGGMECAGQHVRGVRRGLGSLVHPRSVLCQAWLPLSHLQEQQLTTSFRERRAQPKSQTSHCNFSLWASVGSPPSVLTPPTLSKWSPSLSKSIRCPLNDQANTMSREWSCVTWQGRTMLSPTVTSVLEGDTVTRVGSARSTQNTGPQI